MNNETACSLNYFKEYLLPRNYDENMFKADGSINHNYNSFKNAGLIAKIFEDYWQSFYLSNKDLVDTYRKNVTFSYNAHEDEAYHEVTVSVEEFIKMILRHIIPHQFKIIRGEMKELLP